MTIEEMQKEIRQYCLNLILNSTFEDWSNRKLIKNNIIIEINSDGCLNAFTAKIYTDNSYQNKDTEIEFQVPGLPTLPLWCCAHKERSKEKRKIKQKHKEIFSYLCNKSLYEGTLKTYNLLPIKELRKKKLNNINNNENI